MFSKLRERFAYAFSTAPEPLAPEDERFLDELARRVAERKLIAPAVFFGEIATRLSAPLALLAFQTAPIAGPLARFTTLGLIRSSAEYDRLVRLAERREHMDALVRKIEAVA